MSSEPKKIGDLPGKFLALAGLQTAAWWLLLAMNGATWWDDWVMRSLTPSELAEYFKETGRPYFYPIHWLLMHMDWAFYHPLILVASFGITWFFYLILRGFVDKRVAFVSAAVLAVLPMITTRVLAIFIPFMFGLLSFFAAWWLLTRKGGRFGWPTRIAVFALLMWSYTTASLLVWVLVPLAHLVAIRFSRISFRSVLSFVRSEWLIVSSPLIFWLLNRTLAKPYGWYAEYNNPLAFLHEPRMLLILVLVSISIATGCWLLIKRYNRGIQNRLDLALFAFLSILLGSVPYVAIGRNPWHFFGFADRFGLLYPYGLAVLTGLGLVWLIEAHSKLGKSALVVVLVSLSGLTNAALSQYVLDNRVQGQIIEALKQSSSWQDAPTVLFDNQAERLFANHRTNPHYELTGWAQRASGNRTHLAINADELGVWTKLGHFSRVPRYGARDYVATDFGVLVRVVPDPKAHWPSALFESRPLVKLSFEKIPSLKAYFKSVGK